MYRIATSDLTATWNSKHRTTNGDDCRAVSPTAHSLCEGDTPFPSFSRVGLDEQLDNVHKYVNIIDSKLDLKRKIVLKLKT